MHGTSDRPARAREPRTGRRILLVEDHRVPSTLRERLVRLGYTVFAIVYGHDTIHFLGADRVDGVVLDLDTRLLDAVMLLKEIRKHHAHIPIIVMASRGSPHALIRACRYGATDYLIKPVDDELLKHKCLHVF